MPSICLIYLLKIAFNTPPTPSTSDDEKYRAKHGPLPICYMNMENKYDVCAPWQDADASSLWLHVASGLSDERECFEDNLLMICTVTASGEEESAQAERIYAKFIT